MQRRTGFWLLAAVASVGASLLVGFGLPSASAATTVKYFGGTVTVANTFSLTVQLQNGTGSAQDATITVRDANGVLQSPIIGSNTVTGIPSHQVAERAYGCVSGPCDFSVKVVTPSTQVIPSAKYSDPEGDSQVLHGGDWLAQVTT